PNPKLQDQAQQQPAPAPAAQPESRPAPVAEAPAPAPAPVPAKPRREAPAARSTSASRPVTAAPKPAPAPVADSASNGDSRTLTLPSLVAALITPPAPPASADEVSPVERVEPPAPRKVKVPSGTLVGVRMIDSVDSETSHVGDTFKASLDAPIVID